MQIHEISEVTHVEPRHEALLDAAVAVFARYGFRKTSMDEVARAAGVSRQGLYLQFADKEELFRKAVAYKLSRQLTAAVLALSNPSIPLETRLVAACEAWAGQYVGVLGADAADLMCASTTVAGSILSEYELQFEQAVEQAIAASPLADFCATCDVSPADAAAALHATARGLKQGVRSRQEFVRGMTVAARFFCAPMSGRAAAQG